MPEYRLYVGNVATGTEDRDIYDEFDRYGHVTRCDLKAGFAFVHYGHRDEAEDACHHLHDSEMNGRRLIVEMAKSAGPRGSGGEHVHHRSERVNYRDSGYPTRRGRGGGYRGAGSRFEALRYPSHDDRDDRYDRSDRYDRDRSRDRSRGRRHRSQDRNDRTYRIDVENLSSKTRSRDLKDFARDAGRSVVHAEVLCDDDKYYAGVIEFSDKEDYHYALKHLDGKELDGKRVHLYEARRNSKRSKSHEPSRSRSPRRSDSQRRYTSRRRSYSGSNRRSTSRKRSQRRSSPRERSGSGSQRRSVSRERSLQKSRSPLRADPEITDTFDTTAEMNDKTEENVIDDLEPVGPSLQEQS